MKCYIAGPMRGIPEYNYPAFMNADKLLTNAGWVTFNPAKMDIENDDEDYVARSVEEQKLYDDASSSRRFAARDVAVLTGVLRAEDGDAIVVLPGHETSIGAIAEVAVARWCNLNVLTLEDALRWAERGKMKVGAG